MKAVMTSGDIATISYGSEWWAFPVEDLPAFRLCVMTSGSAS